MKKWGVRKESKANPIYVKLVIFFLLLGLTIYLLSSVSIDYPTSALQTQASIAINSRQSQPLTSDNDLETKTYLNTETQESETLTFDDALENQTSPANESQGTEFVTVDEGDVSSNSTELYKNEATPPNSTELYEDESKSSNSTEVNEAEEKASNPTALNEDEAKTSNSTALNEDEAKPSNSTASNEDEESSNSTEMHKEEPSNSTEASEAEEKPFNSTELNEDEAKSSNSPEMYKEETSNSTEVNKAEEKPSNSIELKEDEAKPSNSTELIEDEAKPSNSTEMYKKEPSNSIESHTDEVKPKCDLFKGEWIPDPVGPAYTNKTCAYIESYQDCLTNGRPDSGFLFWRWKPKDCELSKFNPHKFLDLMRNKSWAFIGDSIARNHVQSLLCMLSQVEPPKEIYHDERFKSRTWFFPSYNFTIPVIWSPFIAQADFFEDTSGVTTSEIHLHLDKLNEKWTSQYKDFDYVIIAGGKWFFRSSIYLENNTVHGCHYCPGKNLTDIGFDIAYRKVMQNLFNFITRSSHKPTVFFRPVTPDHFENGEWHNGGTCPRKVPFKNGEVNISDVDRILHEIEMQEFNNAVFEGSQTVTNLKLLYTTQLSLLRPDGHPGPYRNFQPFAAGKNATVIDCLHWCLPGPIDSWNDLVLEMLMNS